MKSIKKKIVNEDHPNRGGSPYHYEPSNEGTTYLCQGKSSNGRDWSVGVFVSPEEESEFVNMKNGGLFRVKEKANGKSDFHGTEKTYPLEQFKSLLYTVNRQGGVFESKNKKQGKDMETVKVTISEERLRKMIAENMKKRLNEVGDTFGGQFKLARLEARYKKAADKAEKEGDYAKAERLRARAQEIRAKSDSEFEDSPGLQGAAQNFTQNNDPFSDMWRAHGMAESQIREAVEKAVKRAINEMVNEVGDTRKGQEMLGRLSAKRSNQSGDEIRKASMALDPDEEEKHRKKAGEFRRRSTAAFVKARYERDKKYDSWTKPGQMMSNAYYGGEKKGKKYNY